MANEIQPFNYGEVEPATAEKLKRHETAIRGIQSKAIYEIGEELQAAHDELSNNRNGTFYAWCESIGIGRDTVKRILNYHSFISANCTNKELLESLPKSLVYEAARPSTPQELKDGVANGDITSLPQFKKLKAELEATKNVLRTTESKLTSAEQERDEAKQLRNAANDLYNQASRKATEQKARAEQAEQERDEAKNELGAMRVSKGNIEAALDKTNADRAKDRETIAQLEVENERLRNQPQAEPEIRVVEKRIEVIPDEYKKAFMENQRMKKELAAHRAHEQDMTVQELARVDEEFKELQKSYEEEERTSERLDYFSTLSSFFPEGQIEARELVRCFLKFHGNEPAEVHSVQRNLKMAIDSLTWIYDALMKPQLEVVK